MGKAQTIQNAREVLERARFDVELIASRLSDGDTDTLLAYASQVARQLDELADMLAETN